MIVSDKPRPMQMVFFDAEGSVTSDSEDTDSDDDTVADDDEFRSQHKSICAGRWSDHDDEANVEIVSRFSPLVQVTEDSDETEFIA